jgi:hypothetical protein
MLSEPPSPRTIFWYVWREGSSDASPELCVLRLTGIQQSARFRATIFPTLRRRNHEYNEGAGSNNESLIMGLSHSLGEGGRMFKGDLMVYLAWISCTFMLLGATSIIASLFFSLSFIYRIILFLIGLFFIVAGIWSVNHHRKLNRN